MPKCKLLKVDKPIPAEVKNFPSDGKLVAKGNRWYVCARSYLRQDDGSYKEKRVYLGQVIDNVFYTQDEYDRFFRKDGVKRLVPREPKAKMEDTQIKGRRRVFHVGPLILPIGAARACAMKEDLLAAGYDDLTADTLLSLAMYLLAKGDSAFCHYEAWSENKPLPLARNLSPKEISKFFADVGAYEDLLENLFALRFKRYGKKEVLSIDSTNIGCESKKISYVTVGKGKKTDYRNQLGMYYVITHGSHMPLYYRYLAGNTGDAATMEHFIKRASLLDADLGYHCAHVGDKGYYSEDNIRLATSHKLKFNVSVKSTVKWIWDVVLEHYEDIKSEESLLRGTGVRGKTYVTCLPNSHEQVYVHCFYNGISREFQIDAFDKELSNFEDAWLAGDKTAVKSQLLRFFKTPKDEVGKCALERDLEVISQENKFKGFFVNITNFAQTTNENLNDYRGRDCIEKLYRADKTTFDFDAIRSHSDATLAGRALVCFIASSLNAQINSDLRVPVTYKQKNGRIRYTAPVEHRYSKKELDSKLDNLHCLVHSNGDCEMTELSAKMREVLEQLNYLEALNDALSYTSRKI